MDKFGFEIIENIGAGTFGTVYKCSDENDNVRCIKSIHLQNISNEVENMHIEMIQHEIYLLQNLAHPRIISLFDYFCSGTYIYIVMEYASHGSLSNLIAQKSTQHNFFNEHEIKQYLIDILLGVEYLHMKGVIHKDLKPCNILICDEERLKIADFGVSKVASLNLEVIYKRSKIKEAGGSPIYSAPETLIYNRFSFSSDIWSLGCILYELCTLQSAFGFVKSMDELIRCTLTKAYIPLNSEIHPCNKEMIDLCDEMMHVDVERRAMVKDIIRSPVIIVDYYLSYFKFDA